MNFKIFLSPRNLVIIIIIIPGQGRSKQFGSDPARGCGQTPLIFEHLVGVSPLFLGGVGAWC